MQLQKASVMEIEEKTVDFFMVLSLPAPPNLLLDLRKLQAT